MRKVGVSMFDLSSKYYDVIYSFKDYEQEAQQVRQYIRRQGKDYRTVLDVACGTAEHAFFLKQHYTIDGIDLNPGIRFDREVEKSGWSLFGCRHDPFSLGPEI
ncbi:hypothetical protein ACPV3A_19785 [Paenibacillus sp. Dod16]|uniref:hypothetical protein n=1 Tax=Paenibacillus sp. Dod16 TaxID=3416392 RepID=UPI003CFAE387